MKVGDATAIGAVVRDRRGDLGLSQTQLAEKAGITRQLLSRFEHGKSDLGLAVVFALFAALDLTVDVRRRDAHPEYTVPSPTITADQMGRVGATVSAAQQAHAVRIEALRRRLASSSGVEKGGGR